MDIDFIRTNAFSQLVALTILLPWNEAWVGDNKHRLDSSPFKSDEVIVGYQISWRGEQCCIACFTVGIFGDSLAFYRLAAMLQRAREFYIWIGFLQATYSRFCRFFFSFFFWHHCNKNASQVGTWISLCKDGIVMWYFNSIKEAVFPVRCYFRKLHTLVTKCPLNSKWVCFMIPWRVV